MSAMTDLVRVECEARQRLHDGSPTRRALSDDYEFVGLLGEATFAREFNQPLNWSRLKGGDGGIDFTLPLRFTLDVKTFRKAGNLIQEQNKVTADIYVLGQYCDGAEPTVELIGWEWGSVLGAQPVKDFGYGIITHYIPRERLRSMSDLHRRLMRLT